MNTIRTATCRCGALSAICEGEPVRVSVCHCLNCQQRSGSAFATQARFPADKVTTSGEARTWVHTADSGNKVAFSFCPNCGTTVWYQGGSPVPELVAVPVGGFADPHFPAPRFSVWEERKHSWVRIEGDEVEHID